jgi:hypothetical protein
VVNTFRLLVTKRAMLRVIQTPLCKLDSGPTPIVLHQPNEKFTLAWSPGFLYSLCRLEENDSLEHGIVGRLGRELAS